MYEAARWMLLLGLIAIGPAQSVAAGPSDNRLAITTHVDNGSSVDHKTQLNAEKVATAIFRKAGVEVHWLDVGLPSADRQEHASDREPFNASDMRLRVISEAMADTFSLPTNVMGLAPGAGLDRRYVYVFYNRVKDLSRRQINVYRKGIVARPATADQILGAMIAHELGHILLNLPSHSETGIMRGDWDLKDLQDIAYGDLLFTPQQAEAIRSEIARRLDKSHAIEVAGP